MKPIGDCCAGCEVAGTVNVILGNATTIVNILDVARASASVTLIRISNDPDAVGVPLITPVVLFNVRPAGNIPVVIDQTYGIVPPIADIVTEYGEPASPPGNDAVVMETDGMIVITRALLALCGVGVVPSVTCTVKLNVPA